MKPTARRLMLNWVAGSVVGTALIAVTSPLFVRSFVPLHADPVRGVWTLPSGEIYRWRSEGYADTHIGPLGMPGKDSIASSDVDLFRVALWGDSQAEGVCVADEDKIFAQAQRLGQEAIEVFPLARSGEDVADWLTQFPAVESELGLDAHVVLVVDLPDLLTTSQVPVPPPSAADTAQAKAAIAETLPAFVIQAARHLLTEDDEVSRRRLRFSVGPVDRGTGSKVSRQKSDQRLIRELDWRAPLADIRAASELPIFLLYAPKSPHVIGGTAVMQDPQDDVFSRLQVAAEAVDVRIIDVRSGLRDSAADGNWPHGFHNGLIGSGHLNAIGNKIVAAGLVGAINAVTEQGKNE